MNIITMIIIHTFITAMVVTTIFVVNILNRFIILIISIILISSIVDVVVGGIGRVGIYAGRIQYQNLVCWIRIIASFSQSERTLTIAAHKRFEPVTSVAPLLLFVQFVCWDQ